MALLPPLNLRFIPLTIHRPLFPRSLRCPTPHPSASPTSPSASSCPAPSSPTRTASTEIVAALNNLDLRRRLAALVRYELETRPVFARAHVTARVEE